MRITALVLVASVAASSPVALHAQSTFGTVVGTVMDSTGAVLPGVHGDRAERANVRPAQRRH
jgi:hypothetical protein